MSRPSRTEEDRLEALEGAAALLSGVQHASGVLAVRLRQVKRRAPSLAELIGLASDELVRIVDGCDSAHELLKRILAAEQERRTQNNGGTDDD